MGVIAVNEKNVKLVKSGHGQTKWLVPSKNGASLEMMIFHVPVLSMTRASLVVVDPLNSQLRSG
jgi:hypothetical protein